VQKLYREKRRQFCRMLWTGGTACTNLALDLVR
jgi:hypothetical protein